MDTIIPVISANNAGIIIFLVFLIFILLQYTAIVYKVVSVEPIITEAIKPILESTPLFFIISVARANDALPDIGLNKARGNISFGKLKKLKIGSISFVIKFIIPELFNKPMAKNSPINVGNIVIVISKPFLAPTKNKSKTFFFSLKPNKIIKSITNGIANIEI